MRALVLALALIPWLAAAADEEVAVDLELFLAVDVSRSMSPRELEIQRRGYAEALASDEVVTAIQRGMMGRIALTYVEWAGARAQRIVVDWSLIETREDAEAFAAKITAHFDDSLRRTSISSAIDYAAASFDGNGFESWRQVIDISGDGPNNSGAPVEPARDAALAKGVVINGLPLMTKEGMGAEWHLDDLDEYYRQCVIGGPASFVVPVLEWDQFPTAVRRKLVLEIAGLAPAPVRVIKAQYKEPPAHGGYDCLIGEKIWERLRYNWGEP